MSVLTAKRPSLRLVAAVAAAALTLAGCAQTPLTERGKQHQAAMTAVVEKADKFGFGGGELARRCAIEFDCKASDYFEYMVTSVQPGESAQQLCARFFDFAEAVKFKSWRRDMHETETLDTASRGDGELACVESLEDAPKPSKKGNALWRQSEGVVVESEIASAGAPVLFNAQLNASIETDGSFRFVFSLMSHP